MNWPSIQEIEKTENETILSSLLMPWELGMLRFKIICSHAYECSGRVSFEAGHRHVDCSKVIWLGTSNIGHDLVFEHQATRLAPKDAMTRDEYVDLMRMLRPKVSDRLGVCIVGSPSIIPISLENSSPHCSRA